MLHKKQKENFNSLKHSVKSFIHLHYNLKVLGFIYHLEQNTVELEVVKIEKTYLNNQDINNKVSDLHSLCEGYLQYLNLCTPVHVQ